MTFSHAFYLITPRADHPVDAAPPPIPKIAHPWMPNLDEERPKMFMSIRRYHSVVSVGELKRRVEKEFVPMLKTNPGFRGFYIVESPGTQGRNVATTISMFDSLDAALASNDIARNFVKERLADLLPEPGEITSGEVIYDAMNAR